MTKASEPTYELGERVEKGSFLKFSAKLRRIFRRETKPQTSELGDMPVPSQGSNTSDASPQVLSADKAITDPREDRLGYAQLAGYLAESICKMSPPEGLVMAVYGPWGSGKTTLLRLVEYYLKQKPEDEQPSVLHFNPWWFSGHENLAKHFFDQMQAVLSKWKYMAGEKAKRLLELAEVLTDKSIAGFLEKDVPELKEQVASAFRNQQRRVLVIIDDIDRLTTEEIRQLFRVIKAVADFPNVVYLLAFDKDVVISALREMQGIAGEDYLEKIVQVPFELPLPDKISLRQLLFDRLEAILADSPSDLFDQVYWGNVYFKGIDHFIETPRDIVRLTNTISVTYPAVRGEANPVDFIAIESLRVFCPLAYGTIRKNPWAFLGSLDTTGFSPPGKDTLKSFHDAWMNQIQENGRGAVRQLLMQIFPTLEAIWGNRHYGADWSSTWRKQLRVCSPDVFPVYFRLTVPEGSLSNAEMQSILALAGDSKAFGAKLVELANQKRPDGTTRVRAFLELLHDYAEDISLGEISSIVEALFIVGDEFPEDQRHHILDFGFGNIGRVFFIVDRLLLRLEEPARFKVLTGAASKGQAISTIVFHMVVLGQQHGKYEARQVRPESERLISSEHLAELERITLEKVRSAARDRSLIHTPELRSVLSTWQDLAGENEVKEWIGEFTSDDKGLVEFLERFLSETFIQGVSDVVGMTHQRFDLERLETVLESSQIIDRARHLVESSELTEKQKSAINHFIQAYEKRQERTVPDTPIDSV